jgi:hypothetical protein
MESLDFVKAFVGSGDNDGRFEFDADGANELNAVAQLERIEFVLFGRVEMTLKLGT